MKRAGHSRPRRPLPDSITASEARATVIPEQYRGKVRCVAFITRAQLARLAKDQIVGLGVGWTSEFNSDDQVLVRGDALALALKRYFAFAMSTEEQTRIERKEAAAWRKKLRR